MSTYYVDEAVFELPDLAFADQTLHRLEMPLERGAPLEIEIRRVPMGRGQSIRQLVDAELAQDGSKLGGFSIEEEQETFIDGSPAVFVRARLRANDAVYRQRKAHVACAETWITIAVTGPDDERAAGDEAFARIVTSLEWRRE